jgi:hypothetical protein
MPWLFMLIFVRACKMTLNEPDSSDRSGQEIEPRLPILSTYLGHVHVSDTYWYLSTCPELMGLAVERLERRCRP